MAEVTCKTHADAIDRMHTFATADNFSTRLIREVRTRLNYLHDAWNNFRTAHVNILQAINEETERAPHLEIFTETEAQFLTADSIMNQRIADVDNDEGVEPGDGNESVDGEQSEENREALSGPPTAHQPSADQDSIIPPNVQVGSVQVVTQQPNVQWPWQFRIENIWGEFDGDKKKWQTFHDSFEARIYDDPSMPAVQKF